MDPLAQIPGLAGYLGMQQNRRQIEIETELLEALSA